MTERPLSDVRSCRAGGAPAGGNCSTAPTSSTRACWKQIGKAPNPKGFVYSDKVRTPNGLDKLTLKAGTAGKAKVLVKARGKRVNVPALPLPLPLRVQLQGDHGECWETTHSGSGVLKNAPPLAKIRAD